MGQANSIPSSPDPAAMPSTRCSSLQPDSPFTNPSTRSNVIFSPLSYNSNGSISPLAASGPATPTAPDLLHTPPHCACGCHRQNANIFDSFTCGLNLFLSRTREHISDLIHDCVRAHFSRGRNNPLLPTDPASTPMRPSEIRAWMLEAVDDVMGYEVKREVSMLPERLRRRILEHVDERIEDEWGIKLQQEDARNDYQQVTEDTDEEMLSPGLSEMSDSLSSVSLDPPAQATSVSRTRQHRRDSPAPASNARFRRTRTSERLAERMHAVEEQAEIEVGEMDSSDRKKLKRKHEGLPDQVREATRAKKLEGKKLFLS